MGATLGAAAAHLHDPLTYADIVLAALRRCPDRIAFRHGDRTLTYRQTTELLAHWVSLFGQRGLQRGQGVGILSENRPEVWIGQSATILAGGRYTALQPADSFDDQLRACNE